MPAPMPQAFLQQQSPAPTCQQVVSFLVDYLGDGMGTPTRVTLERHLSDCVVCVVCVAFFATYQATLRAIHTLRDEAIPTALLVRLQRFLHARIIEASHKR